MRVTIPPVMTEKTDATEVCLGEMALAALENSKNAMPVTREEIEDFCFKENVEGAIKYVVTAKTKDFVIKSYFCEDGDDWLEILLEMNDKLSIKQKIQINECMDNIIKSIKIE